VGEGAHAANESVMIPEFARRAALLAALIEAI
jgi:acetylornithine deacetylase/succinyl-diaminopimelate desuccinylase-like protein